MFLCAQGGELTPSPSTAPAQNPSGVAADAARNVYVADTYNHRIRLVTPSGTTSTLAGSEGIIGTEAFANGVGVAARFYVRSLFSALFSLCARTLRCFSVRKAARSRPR